MEALAAPVLVLAPTLAKAALATLPHTYLMKGRRRRPSVHKPPHVLVCGLGYLAADEKLAARPFLNLLEHIQPSVGVAPVRRANLHDLQLHPPYGPRVVARSHQIIDRPEDASSTSKLRLAGILREAQLVHCQLC